MESWINSSVPRLASGSMAAADISDNMATGPVCRKRDAPHMYATITGKKEAYRPYTTGKPASEA